MINQPTPYVVDIAPIRILPPQLANQIAAGEVVERPASVVKELLENSLDAGATNVLIEIEQGGQKRILIRDNGAGIAKDQLALALSRHATSKISNIDDLEHITSMGFRGEALASISSVSRLTITSKPPLQSEAWQAIAEGSQMDVVLKPAAHPDGTSIEVLDLFFNTPARRKFLRTGKTEFQHIEQIVKRIALARPDVHFELKHNQKVYCRYTNVQSIAKRIEQVCGKSMLANSVAIDYQFDGVVVSGWCSRFGFGQATRDFQYTFVNGRMMKDKLLAHALRQVYEDTLPPQTFASYVLYLQVSPQQIDVNVHPAKHEVRFHQSRQVHDIVFKAVNDALSHDGNDGAVNEPATTPSTHNYIQALTPNTSLNTGRSGQYRANVPTKAELTANEDFYQSVVSQPRVKVDAAVQSDTGLKLQHENVIPAVTTSSFLYSAGYLVSVSSGNLQILDITFLLRFLISERIARSTLAQPLLMPISVGNKQGIKQVELDVLSEVNILMVASHQKIILKQVPSELRHLPWTSIFSHVDIKQLVDASKRATQQHTAQNKIEYISHVIVSAWLPSLNINNTMLDGWITEVGSDNVDLLCSQYGRPLHLPTFMESPHE